MEDDKGWKKGLSRLRSKHKEDAHLAGAEMMGHTAVTYPEGLPESHVAEHPLSNPLKIYLRIGGCVLILVVFGWVLSSVYLSKIEVGNTKISAHANDQAVLASLSKQALAYHLSVRYPDKKEKKYPLSQLGLRLDAKTSVRATRQRQHQFNNRLQWWKPVPADLVFKKDNNLLNNFITTNINVTVQPSLDATLTFINGQIKLTDAVAGKQYGLDKPQEKLLDTAKKLQDQPIKLQTLTVNPALTAKLLEPYKALLEKTINQPGSFTIGSKTITPTPADISKWLEITPDDKTKKVDITVNSGKVLEYIDHIAAAYINPARAQVEIKQTDGSPNRVLVAGVNGADITNKKEVATSVAKNLLSSQGFDFSLPLNYQAYQTVTTDLFDKWIEVDLTNKRLYAYEKTNLVKTELVSAGAPSTPTVTGQYSIYAKFNQQDMRGNNVDGSKYFQPHVRWINYFYKDYAIHGNYWRPTSYFGNINSSHGCVSMVDGEAEWVYNWAPIGTQVIVHS